MKKLILATTASLAFAFSVSAQTATYSAEQLQRAATKSAEQKATAPRFTEAPAVKAVTKTAPVVSTPATNSNATVAATPATTTTAAKQTATTQTVAAPSNTTLRVDFNRNERPVKAGPGVKHDAPNGRAKLPVQTTKKAPVTGASKSASTK